MRRTLPRCRPMRTRFGRRGFRCRTGAPRPERARHARRRRPAAARPRPRSSRQRAEPCPRPRSHQGNGVADLADRRVGEDRPVGFGRAELVEGDVDAEHHCVHARHGPRRGRVDSDDAGMRTVERRTAPCSMPAIRRSVTYSSRPEVTARASSLGVERPTEAPARAAVSRSAMASHLQARRVRTGFDAITCRPKLS